MVREVHARKAWGPGDLMSFAEVAAMFPGKNRRWVRDFLVAPKRVESVKLGRDRFVVRESVVRLIAQSTRRMSPHASLKGAHR